MSIKDFIQDQDARELWNRFESLLGQQLFRLRVGDQVSPSCPSSLCSLLSSETSSSDRMLSIQANSSSQLERNSNALCNDDLNKHPMFGLPYIAQSMSPLLNLIVVSMQEMRAIGKSCNLFEIDKRQRENKRCLYGIYKKSLTLESQLHQYMNPSLVTSLNRRSAKATFESELLGKMMDKLRKESRKSATEIESRKKSCDLTLKMKALLGRQKCEWQCVGRLKETLTMAREMKGMLKFICQLSCLLEQNTDAMRRVNERPPPYEYSSPYDDLYKQDFSQVGGNGQGNIDTSDCLTNPAHNFGRQRPTRRSQSEVTISLSMEFPPVANLDEIDIDTYECGDLEQSRGRRISREDAEISLSDSDICIARPSREHKRERERDRRRSSRRPSSPDMERRKSSNRTRDPSPCDSSYESIEIEGRSSKRVCRHGSSCKNHKMDCPCCRTKSSGRSKSRKSHTCSCSPPSSSPTKRTHRHDTERRKSVEDTRKKSCPDNQRNDVKKRKRKESVSPGKEERHSTVSANGKRRKESPCKKDKRSPSKADDSEKRKKSIKKQLAQECAEEVARRRSKSESPSGCKRVTLCSEVCGPTSPPTTHRTSHDKQKAKSCPETRRRDCSELCVEFKDCPGRSDRNVQVTKTNRSGSNLSDIEGSRDHLLSDSDSCEYDVSDVGDRGRSPTERRKSSRKDRQAAESDRCAHKRASSANLGSGPKFYLQARHHSSDSSGSREPLLFSSRDTVLSFRDDHLCFHYQGPAPCSSVQRISGDGECAAFRGQGRLVICDGRDEDRCEEYASSTTDSSLRERDLSSVSSSKTTTTSSCPTESREAAGDMGTEEECDNMSVDERRSSKRDSVSERRSSKGESVSERRSSKGESVSERRSSKGESEVERRSSKRESEAERESSMGESEAERSSKGESEVERRSSKGGLEAERRSSKGESEVERRSSKGESEVERRSSKGESGVERRSSKAESEVERRNSKGESGVERRSSKAESESERRSSKAESEAERRSSKGESEAERRSSKGELEVGRKSSRGSSEAERRSSKAESEQDVKTEKKEYQGEKVVVEKVKDEPEEEKMEMIKDIKKEISDDHVEEGPRGSLRRSGSVAASKTSIKSEESSIKSEQDAHYNDSSFISSEDQRRISVSPSSSRTKGSMAKKRMEDFKQEWNDEGGEEEEEDKDDENELRDMLSNSKQFSDRGRSLMSQKSEMSKASERNRSRSVVSQASRKSDDDAESVRSRPLSRGSELSEDTRVSWHTGAASLTNQPNGSNFRQRSSTQASRSTSYSGKRSVTLNEQPEEIEPESLPASSDRTSGGTNEADGEDVMPLLKKLFFPTVVVTLFIYYLNCYLTLETSCSTCRAPIPNIFFYLMNWIVHSVKLVHRAPAPV